jgi:hypothetical protein
MSHTLGLPSIDDFLFHHRANRLTPPWPVSKGVCAGKKHGPTPNRQRGIVDAARSSFSPLEGTIYSNKIAVRRAKTDVVKECKELRGQADLPVVLRWGYVVA